MCAAYIRDTDRDFNSPLAEEIDALVAAGFGGYLRPCAPPGAKVSVKKNGKIVEVDGGKIPAKFERGKWVGFKGWRNPTAFGPDEVKEWRRWPDAGLCLLAGDVVAFDLDININPADETAGGRAARQLAGAIKQIIADELGVMIDALPRRWRSNSTSSVLFARADEEFDRAKVAFKDGEGREHAVEFLALGQQVVIAGHHKSGVRQQSNIVDFGYDGLPPLNRATFETIWSRIRAEIESAGFTIIRTGSAGASISQNKHPSPRTMVWREVMRRRDEWAPSVLPSGSDGHDDHWGISNPSRPWRIGSDEDGLDRNLEEDLVIYIDGIYDHGSERPHTPLSLICEFGAIDDTGEISFGGSPEYGPKGGQSYAAIGEPDRSIRRPTEEQALSWLANRLEGSTQIEPREGEDRDRTMARILGLEPAALDREYVYGWFSGESADTEWQNSPKFWTRRQIEESAARLPAMRAADSKGFADLVETWDLTLQCDPKKVAEIIARETKRVRENIGAEPPPNSASADPREIPVREWLIMPTLPMYDVCQIAGAPGVSKSTLMIRYALAVSTGRENIIRGQNLQGRPISPERLHRSGSVIVYDAEDRLDEMKRRLEAAKRHCGIGEDLNRHQVLLWSGVDGTEKRVDDKTNDDRTNYEIKILRRVKNGDPLKPAAGLKMLEAEIRKTRALLVILGPQVGLMINAVENSNDDADALFQELARLASRTGCAIIVVHHTSKSSQDNAGDMAAGRGAFAAVGKSRAALTLVNVTGAGAGEKEWGVTREDGLVRLDFAKVSHAIKPNEPVVFRRLSIPVGNGTGDDPEKLETLLSIGPREALEIAGDQAPVLEVVDREALKTAALEKTDAARERRFDDRTRRIVAEVVAREMGDTEMIVISAAALSIGDRLRKENATNARTGGEIKNFVIDALSPPVTIDSEEGRFSLRVEKQRQPGKAGGKEPWCVVRTSCPASDASEASDAE